MLNRRILRKNARAFFAVQEHSSKCYPWENGAHIWLSATWPSYCIDTAGIKHERSAETTHVDIAVIIVRRNLFPKLSNQTRPVKWRNKLYTPPPNRRTLSSSCAAMLFGVSTRNQIPRRASCNMSPEHHISALGGNSRPKAYTRELLLERVYCIFFCSVVGRSPHRILHTAPNLFLGQSSTKYAALGSLHSSFGCHDDQNTRFQQRYSRPLQIYPPPPLIGLSHMCSSQHASHTNNLSGEEAHVPCARTANKTTHRHVSVFCRVRRSMRRSLLLAFILAVRVAVKHTYKYGAGVEGSES